LPDSLVAKHEGDLCDSLAWKQQRIDPMAQIAYRFRGDQLATRFRKRLAGTASLQKRNMCGRALRRI